MKKFIQRSSLFFLPLIIFGAITIGSFYLYDPFKILKDYNEYKKTIVAYNEDYIATERFLKNKDSYNSFILGSSRAGCGFDVKAWETKLNPLDKAYSFTASNESIFGIVGKLRLIDKMKGRLDNVLLVIDLDRTMKKTINSKGHLYIKHPLVSGESFKSFTYEYLKDYIFSGFVFAYLDYKIFYVERDYMQKYLTLKNENAEGLYIPFDVKEWEAHIQTDPDGYYNNNKEVFYPRSTNEQYQDIIINSKNREYLDEIWRLFTKHNTNYKIVISPLYDQKKIHENDLNTLTEIFGTEHIFDFSGKNAITEDLHNYYEASHYRAHIGKHIIEKISIEMPKYLAKN